MCVFGVIMSCVLLCLWFCSYSFHLWISMASIELLHILIVSSLWTDLGPVESETLGSLTGEEQEEAEKVQLLKQKILSNASAIPIVLKRMKECMSRIDKLESHNGFIHPAFKRKRTS